MKKIVYILIFLLFSSYSYSADEKLTELDAITPDTADMMYCVDDVAGTPTSKSCLISTILTDTNIPSDLTINSTKALTCTSIDTGEGATEVFAMNQDIETTDNVTFNQITLTTDLTVPNGGTGASTFTDGGILLGSGTGAITALGVASNGQIPIGDGATDPVLATITATPNETTVTNGAGSITIGLTDPIVTNVTGSSTETASNATWTIHDSYPAACAVGSYTQAIGDTLTCTDASIEIDSIVANHAAINDAHQDLVTLAGTPDYITLSGQVITRNLIDLTADVTGLLPSANIVDEFLRNDGDTSASNYTMTGDWDFGSGGIEIENNTAIPGSCTIGQIFLDTDGTSGQQLYACEGGSFVQQGGSASSPLTTKGDIWGYSTVDARIPVGTNGQVLTADSTEALGVKWAAAGGVGTVTSVAAGDGMDFTTITSSGNVTMGTPGNLTTSTSNGVTTTSHTHAITSKTGADTNFVTGTFGVSGDIIAWDVNGDAISAVGGSFSDGNITNVGDIALDSISSDAGTSINVTLGTDAGDDFIVDVDKLIVQGDQDGVIIGGTGTSTFAGALEVNGSNGSSINFGTAKSANPCAGASYGAGTIYYSNDNVFCFCPDSVTGKLIDNSGTCTYN